MKIEMSDPILVYAPEMTEAVSRWGVYAIPRMWRALSGELVVRFNGEEDSLDIENMQCAPNLYFVSSDEGKTWHQCYEGEEKYDISVLTGIDPPYRKRKNGDTVFVKYEKHLPPIENVPYQKEFMSANQDAVLRSYRWGDIPEKCRKIHFGRIDAMGTKTEIFETNMDFPEREIHIVSKARSGESFVKVDEYVQPFIFRLPYFSSICETKENELVGVCYGQNPDIRDKYYTEVYLVASADGGKTWKKRAAVAGGISDLPHGYGGDGGEISLTIDPSGTLYCVMRMDVSTDPRYDSCITDTMFCISHDSGYSWSKPRCIADSSVTPHIIALGNTLVLVYGRPGVHLKYSIGGGKEWSKPHTVIGKTLEDERASGRDDFESKYGNPYSYCNTFWERISENEFLLLYNDLTYPDKNGKPTKAAFVRRIKVVE